MKASANTIDLSSLPDSARREVRDFYQFIAQRYQPVQRKQTRALKKMPAEFYKPILVPCYHAVTRDEIYRDIA